MIPHSTAPVFPPLLPCNCQSHPRPWHQRFLGETSTSPVRRSTAGTPISKKKYARPLIFLLSLLNPQCPEGVRRACCRSGKRTGARGTHPGEEKTCGVLCVGCLSADSFFVLWCWREISWLCTPAYTVRTQHSCLRAPVLPLDIPRLVVSNISSDTFSPHLVTERGITLTHTSYLATPTTSPSPLSLVYCFFLPETVSYSLSFDSLPGGFDRFNHDIFLCLSSEPASRFFQRETQHSRGFSTQLCRAESHSIIAMAMGTGEWIEGPIPDGFPYYPHQLQTGHPVGYYSPQTEQGAQLPVHTQYFPSDPRTVFAQQPLQQTPDAPQSHHHAQTLMSPSVSSCGDAASAHGSPWSSPDHEAEFDGYSYHGSPLSADVPATYNHAPVSPAPWSSPMQMPFRSVDEQKSAGFQQARMCSPVSNGSPHMAQSLYPHTSHPFGTPAHSPPMGMPPQTTPPTTTTTTSVPTQFMPPSPEGTSEMGGPPEEGEDGGHEPYSKQLVKALMSFPGHAATVQQIYNWFEANTNRSESTGWKNSIRHNLSLNKVSTGYPICLHVPSLGVPRGSM